jgi:hypothetical protein
MERLNWEMKKDQEQTDRAKQKLIEEIKSYDKSKMFIPPTKQKRILFHKIMKALGYGKKR